MYQTNIQAAAIDGYQTMAFSDRVLKLCARAGISPATTRPAKTEEALAALGVARTHLGGLVPDEVAAAAIAHNPEIFHLVEGDAVSAERPAFLAYLPLNRSGAEALVNGRFRGAEPDLAMVCRADEPPCAIYIWLIFAPGALTPALRALAPLLGRLAPEGCPLFTRGVTGHTARLFPAMGFVTARHVYPSAPEDLLAQLWTWQHGDISAHPDFGGDLAKALASIRAKVLLMPGDHDLYFRVEDNRRELAHLANGELKPIPSIWGHRAGNPLQCPEDARFIESAVKTLLED